MNKTWKTAIFNRNMAHNRYLNNKSDSNYESYRILQNKCANQSRFALEKYFSKNCLAETKSEKPKHFWKIIKLFFSKKSKQSENIKLDIDGEIVSEPSAVAEHFNDYFLKIAKTIGENSAYSGNIDQHLSYRVIKDHVSKNNIPVFNFKPVNEESDIINRLPTGKAPGYDNIAGQCLKVAKSSIVLPLQCLLNRMFVESSFPEPLKHADISPIYKKKQQTTHF